MVVSAITSAFCHVNHQSNPHQFPLAFGDNKQWIRTAGARCVDEWCLRAGGAHVAFDGEMVADALRAGSPALRAALFTWLAASVPTGECGTPLAPRPAV